MNVRELNETSERFQITSFNDDVAPIIYQKPGVSEVADWLNFGEDQLTHSVKDILARPVIVKQGDLSSSDNEVFALRFPDILLQSSTNLVSKLNKFTYFRANVKIKMVYNAVPFQAGRYWMYFAPFENECNRPRLGTLQNATGYPGVEIDIAHGAPLELTIPYCAPLSHYNLVNKESTMGDLILMALSPLASGISPITSSYTVFAWFEDIHLSLPTCYDTQVPAFEAQALVGELVDSAADVIIPSVTTAASNVVSRLVSAPLTWMQRAARSFASSIGLNKPLAGVEHQTFTNQPGRGYTHANGVDHSVVLAAMPDNAIQTIPGVFSSDVDEMDIDFVKRKSCVFTNSPVSWTSSNAVGSILAVYPVQPGFCDATTNSATANCTTLAFLSSMFNLWRGGLHYRFSVAKTAFHSGRLRFTFIPRGSTSLSTLPVDSESCYNWILDLSCASDIEFTIPYVSNRPWMPIEVTPSGTTAGDFSESAIGDLRIEVLTGLKSTSNLVTGTVKILPWISGAPDLEFAIPDFGDYKIRYTVTADELPDFEAQVFQDTTQAIDHQEQMNDNSVSLFADITPGSLSACSLTIGEKITSLRQLIKRFGPMFIGYPQPFSVNSFPFTQKSIAGPMLANNTTEQYCINSIRIDPAYFGEKDINDLAYITRDMPVTIDPTDQSILDLPCLVARKMSPVAPLHYISYLYRFYRGGKRYKMWLGPNKETKSSNSSLAPPPVYNSGTATWTYNDPNFMMSSSEANLTRSSIPYIVSRNSIGKQDNVVAAPTLRAGQRPPQNSLFEHIQMPDLNNCLEFEVPYYSTLPISVVGEGDLGNDKGPLVQRSTVDVYQGFTLEDSEVPFTVFESASAFGANPNLIYRNSIGSFRLYTAAADDFSFGYLVGAPKIIRSQSA